MNTTSDIIRLTRYVTQRKAKCRRLKERLSEGWIGVESQNFHFLVWVLLLFLVETNIVWGWRRWRGWWGNEGEREGSAWCLTIFSQRERDGRVKRISKEKKKRRISMVMCQRRCMLLQFSVTFTFILFYLCPFMFHSSLALHPSLTFFFLL